MTLSKRISARLDVKGSRLIKGIRYEGLRVVGDLSEAAISYASQGADELLYIDTVASLYGRSSLGEILRDISKEVFIPITAGGGIRTVQDAAYLLACGADKVAVNTAAIKRKGLISELANTFGSQSVVVSIQARKVDSNNWEAMIEAGRERTGKDVMEWVEEVQQEGAGEILLTSVDQDGTCLGPDRDLILECSRIGTVPLVVSGGFTQYSDICECLKVRNISCVAIGAALHYKKLSIPEVKNYLVTNTSNFSVRNLPKQTTALFDGNKLSSSPIVCIVDYAMGNQQSLVNAFNSIGATTVISSDAEILKQSDIVVLPGVGAFPEGMRQLILRNLDSEIVQMASRGKPVLGICLGMQMLFERSTEFSLTQGLGLLKGNVDRLPEFDHKNEPLLVPHVGWNELYTCQLNDFNNNKINGTVYQYFVHSFAALPDDKKTIMFTTNYGGHEIVAGSLKDNICGLQFHPERSGTEGLLLLKEISEHLLALETR